jgi:trehalose/maltose transport system substrate-binding protein
VDVVWPGMLGRYFADLGPYFSKEDLRIFNPAGVAANTVDGKLVGIPFYGDVGLLYYRVDLLKKYGYPAAPPATWAEMRAAAAKIQAGERAAGKASFWGYVFDGMAYEGLTCNTLEWIASCGGGTYVDAAGNVTVDNPQAVAAYREAASWMGAIVPPGATSYKTEDARGVWQAGNAAFMRNWPFAYALGERDDSPIKGAFAVGAIPHGPGGESVSTLGGWQLAVSRYSKHPAEAAGLIKFLANEANQKERMLKLARIPTAPALFQDPDILAATPWLETFNRIKAVPRPAAATKSKYNEASAIIFNLSRAMLLKEISAEEGVKRMARDLQQLKGGGW